MESKLYGRVRWYDEYSRVGQIRGDDGRSYYIDTSVFIFPYRGPIDQGCRVSFRENVAIEDCLCARDIEWVSEGKCEVGMETICGLKKSQFEKIYQLYLKGIDVIPKTGGWEGWNAFSRPYEDSHNLIKLTFEILTKEKPTQDQIELALRNELVRRLEMASDDFTSSVFRYFKHQTKTYMEMFKVDIHDVIIDNSKLFENVLLENIELPEVNQLFQRIKDFNAYQAELDLLVEAERACRQQAQDRRMQQDLKPIKKKTKGQKLKENEFGELKAE